MALAGAFISIFSWVFGLFYSKFCMASMNFWHLLFSIIPIRSDDKASFGVTGTLAIFNPPLEKKPAYLFCNTYVPSMDFHSKYLETLVLRRILTSLPPDMIYLGIRSIFQSLLCPNSFGGSYFYLKSFQRLVRLTEAPYPP